MQEFAGCVDYYLRHKHLFLYDVVYEDLLADPEGETGRFFSAIGVPKSLVGRALTAMQVHSQGGMFEIEKYKVMTEKDFRDTDEVRIILYCTNHLYICGEPATL